MTCLFYAVFCVWLRLLLLAPAHVRALEVNSEEPSCPSSLSSRTLQDLQPKPQLDPYPYKWNPQDEHPCTIERMSMDDYLNKFGPRGLPLGYADPLVVAADGTQNKFGRNHQFREVTDIRRILDEFSPNFTVTLSSSNTFSEHRRTIPFETYLREQLYGSDGRGEVYPHQRANETWYLFGETFTKPWLRLLESYRVPPCEGCRSGAGAVALAFGVGNRGSGVQWHVHGPGFSESLHGRKHWILSFEKPDFHPDQTSRNWMETEYARSSDRPLECTLEPGDFLYFPDGIWHATINLDPYTAFVSSFLSYQPPDKIFGEED